MKQTIIIKGKVKDLDEFWKHTKEFPKDMTLLEYVKLMEKKNDK
jgi:hypothetical protein